MLLCCVKIISTTRAADHAADRSCVIHGSVCMRDRNRVCERDSDGEEWEEREERTERIERKGER